MSTSIGAWAMTEMPRQLIDRRGFDQQNGNVRGSSESVVFPHDQRPLRMCGRDPSIPANRQAPARARRGGSPGRHPEARVSVRPGMSAAQAIAQSGAEALLRGCAPSHGSGPRAAHQRESSERIERGLG